MAGRGVCRDQHEEWARPEAQRLEELRLVAHELLVEAELLNGRAADVLPTVESLVAAHPLRERFRAQLVVALYRTGRQADALRAVREYRETLREELGLEPSPPLADLERAVLNHEASLAVPPASRFAAIASVSGWGPATTAPCMRHGRRASTVTS